MFKRLFCAVFHRRYHEMQPFLSLVKPFGGMRRVCLRCDASSAAMSTEPRRHNGPVQFDGKSWKPISAEA